MNTENMHKNKGIYIVQNDENQKRNENQLEKV